jgi:hypothetical protein
MESHIIMMALTIIILIGMALAFREKKNYNRAPKRIWTYWDPLSKRQSILPCFQQGRDREDRIPKTVKMCLRNWAKWNPDYEIVLLTKKNYQGYVTIPSNVTSHPIFDGNPSRCSELVRLWILAERGGIWMDPSIILQAPLDDWMFPKYAEFSGFYRKDWTKDPEQPMIEPWFMACNKGCELITKWRDAYSELANYPSIERYIESRRVSVSPLNPMDHLIQVALQQVFQHEKYKIDSIIVQVAEEGPLKYLIDTKWNSEKAIHATITYPIIMMREQDREVLE